MSGDAPGPRVESPCVRICRQDRQAGFCIGCGRTVREVFDWFEMSAIERAEVMDRLPARLDSLKVVAGR